MKKLKSSKKAMDNRNFSILKKILPKQLKYVKECFSVILNENVWMCFADEKRFCCKN